MYLLALSVILYSVDKSLKTFAWFVVAQALGTLAMQFFASAAADSGEAQRIASTAEWVRAVLVFAGGLCVVAGYPSMLILIGFLTALVQPFYRTSLFKFGPLLFTGQKLAVYNARVATTQQVGLLLGAALAGVLLTISPLLPVWINAISYVASGTFVHLSRIPDQHPKDKGDSLAFFKRVFHPAKALDQWRGVVEVLRFHRYILFLIWLISVEALVINFCNMTYPLFIDRLKVSSVWISWWDVLFAVGSIAGANAFAYVKRFQNSRHFVLLFMAAETAIIAALAITNQWEMLAVFFGIGVGHSMIQALAAFHLQSNLPKEVAGRIAGLRQLGTTFCVVAFLPLLSRLLDANFAHGLFSLTGLFAITVVLGVVNLALRKRA